MLLTHDHHGDNLDDAGRALLPSAGAVVTTTRGGRAARRTAQRARTVEHDVGSTHRDGRRSTITATPCRHGPPLSRPIVGDVVGFALRWEGQQTRVLWISGDTVLYDGVRQVAERLEVDVALLHLGGVKFPGHRARSATR